MNNCPLPNQFERLLAEQLASNEQDAIETHIERCAQCQRQLEEMTQTREVARRHRDNGGQTPPAFLRQLRKRPPDHTAGEAAQVDFLLGPAPSPTFPNGRSDLVPTVAGYEILGELGRGGMGVVYKARHQRLNRLVALKMILTGADAGPAERDRFYREAESAAALEHPHIVQIYEIGEQDGRPYLALEFVEGGSLAHKLDGTPQPARSSAELVETLARAMHAAHQRGIIHRDLKPANVLLTTDGTPKVSDFGLAKRFAGESVPGEANASDWQSRSGQLLGTPSYMAPEQASRAWGPAKDGPTTRAVSPATDVYSLGAILYELLTGRAPFKAETDLDTVIQVVYDEPLSPTRLQPKVPRDLETICLKCLHKIPLKRYPSALELAEDLRRFLAGEPIQAKPVGAWERALKWGQRRPAIMALSSGLVLLAAVSFALVGWQWFRAEQALFMEQQRAQAEEEAKFQAEQQKDQAQRERRFAQRLSADLILDRGLKLCEEGDIATGLLWLGWGLQAAPPEATDLDYVGRVNLAAWRQQLPPLRARLSHPDTIAALALSPDGTLLVTACKDRRIRFWEMKTGQLLERSLPYRNQVHGIAFSPDGKTILTGSADRTVRIWDAVTLKQRGGPLRHSKGIIALALSADGGTLAAACMDRGLHFWNVRTRKQSGAPLQHPEGQIRAIALSPDGKIVATGGEDKTARLWETATLKPLLSALVHPSAVRAVAFSPDGKRLVTGCADSTARLWEALTGDAAGPPLRHRAPVEAVAFSPDGKMVLTAGGDSTARLWDAHSGQPLGAVLRHGGEVKSAAFAPDGRSIVTHSLETACVWELADHQPPTAEQDEDWSQEGPVRALAISSCGTKVLTTLRDKTAQARDIVTLKRLGPALVHAGSISTATFHPDGNSVVTCAGAAAQGFQVETGKALGVPFRHSGQILAVAFDPEGAVLATGGRDGTVRLWDVATSQPKGVVLRPESEVRAVAFSPDGKTILTGSDSGKVQRWNRATGQALGSAMLHHGWVQAVAFSPDGRVVLTGSRDGTAQRWEAATGLSLGAPLVHPREVGAVAFSPDGLRFLTGCHDGMARLWHTATGKPLGSPFPHQGRIDAVAFHPDGQRLLIGSRDEAARVWNVPVPVEGEIERLVSWAQVVTGMELDDGGTLRVLTTSAWRERSRRLQELGGPPP
jgi:WD40 repeat protein/serine/threonine protein kinase